MSPTAKRASLAARMCFISSKRGRQAVCDDDQNRYDHVGEKFSSLTHHPVICLGGLVNQQNGYSDTSFTDGSAVAPVDGRRKILAILHKYRVRPRSSWSWLQARGFISASWAKALEISNARSRIPRSTRSPRRIGGLDATQRVIRHGGCMTTLFPRAEPTDSRPASTPADLDPRQLQGCWRLGYMRRGSRSTDWKPGSKSGEHGTLCAEPGRRQLVMCPLLHDTGGGRAPGNHQRHYWIVEGLKARNRFPSRFPQILRLRTRDQITKRPLAT